MQQRRTKEYPAATGENITYRRQRRRGPDRRCTATATQIEFINMVIEAPD
jgi:hypothetical protein